MYSMSRRRWKTALAPIGQASWPKSKYLYEQLKYFRDGDRMNALMMGVTPYLKTLNDQDLLDIAAFYSDYNVTVGQAKMMKNYLR